MGEFAQTCALSGLPIYRKDEVKYFLITENPHSAITPVYPQDIFFPRTWPIDAKYNSYGSICDYDSNSPAVKSFLDAFNYDLVETNGLSRDSLCFGDLLEAIWDRNVQVQQEHAFNKDYFKGKSEKFLTIYQCFILKDVWDKICTQSGNFSKYREEIDFRRNISLDINLSDIEMMKTDIEGLDRLFEKLKNYKPDPVYKYNAVPFSMGLDEHLAIASLLNKKTPFSTEQLETFKDSIAGFMCIHELIYSIRYWWRPSFPIGGQFGKLSKHSAWHQLLLDVISSKKKKTIEDGEDEDE